MRIYTSPWLYAKGREIDILVTLEENYEKCPPLDQFLDTRLQLCYRILKVLPRICDLTKSYRHFEFHVSDTKIFIITNLWHFRDLKVAITLCFWARFMDGQALVLGPGMDILVYPTWRPTCLHMHSMGRCIQSRFGFLTFSVLALSVLLKSSAITHMSLTPFQVLLYHRMCKPDFLCSWPSLNSYLK